MDRRRLWFYYPYLAIFITLGFIILSIYWAILVPDPGIKFDPLGMIDPADPVYLRFDNPDVIVIESINGIPLEEILHPFDGEKFGDEVD